MFNYIKEKFKAVKQYLQDGLTDFIKEPAIAIAQAAVHAGAQKIKSELAAAAAEAAENLSHKAEDTARFVANDRIQLAGQMLRNTFARSNSPVAMASDESPSPKSNMITTLLKVIYSFITEILYKFISKFVSSLIAVSLPRAISAPVAETTAPTATQANVNSETSSPILASVASEQNIHAVRTLISNLWPVAMQALSTAPSASTTNPAPAMINAEVQSADEERPSV